MRRLPSADAFVSTGSKRRPRRPSPTNDEFIEKAFELFAELGYEGTTINLITESIGVTKRTVYAKFGDKDAVFLAALRYTISNWIIPSEELKTCESEGLRETLVVIAFKLLDNLLSPRGLQLLQMTTALSLKSPEMGAHNVQHGIMPTLGYLADLFGRRIANELGTFQSLEGAAMAFVNLTVGGVVNLVGWGVLLDKAAIENYIHSSVDVFMNGLVGQAAIPNEAMLEENTRLKMLVADLVMAEKFR
jgi:TetR/AcrR family transcriptional repressor of mexJK operon